MRNDAEARWMAAMRRGDFAAALAISDAVLSARDPGTRDDPALPYHCRWVWDGSPVDGVDVLIRCYHGLGDTLQFARFIPRIVRRAASVAVEAPVSLLPLLTALHRVRLIPWNPARPSPPSGCDIEIMELFQVCRPEPEQLPLPLPLPPVPPLPMGAGAIGLCWEAGEWDCARSVPLPRLLDAVGCERPLVSLQRGRAASEAIGRFVNPADHSTEIARTAALIAGVSEVVTVDTMVAHLAGSLGAPVRLLLRREADWRWMTGRDDTPWYPGMRLYRQERDGDWSAPLARLARDVRNRPAG